MATIPLPPDFSEFLTLLNDHEVRYLLVGDHAVSYHGYVRSMAYMDVWIERKEKNASKVVNALKEFGFTVDQLTPELFLQKNKVIRMGVPPLEN